MSTKTRKGRFYELGSNSVTREQEWRLWRLPLLAGIGFKVWVSDVTTASIFRLWDGMEFG
jgi:hypothetical protein